MKSRQDATYQTVVKCLNEDRTVAKGSELNAHFSYELFSFYYLLLLS